VLTPYLPATATTTVAGDGDAEDGTSQFHNN
jgi:hypothetical protein